LRWDHETGLRERGKGLAPVRKGGKGRKKGW